MMKKSENNTGTVLHWHKYDSLPHDSTLHQQGPCIISSDSITRDRCNEYTHSTALLPATPAISTNCTNPSATRILPGYSRSSCCSSAGAAM
jgi:hypothetical protein